MAWESQENIGDYEILDLIGTGAQGRIYKVRCVSDRNPNVKRDEVLALKMLSLPGHDEKSLERLHRQVEILRQLQHDSIVRYRDSFVWHSGEWDESQCVVMELLEGATLQEVLKRHPRGLPWKQAKAIMEQCLAALIHTRERSIVHRDIKPSNIFITHAGQAKLIDFDVARQENQGQASTIGYKGTFDYMAPDFITEPEFRGDELSDIFSLGITFYQALTGRLPYPGQQPEEESSDRRKEKDPERTTRNTLFEYLARWKPGQAPPEMLFDHPVFKKLKSVKPFIIKCTRPQRDQRYPSFAAMLADLQRIGVPSPWPWLSAAAALLLLAGGGAAGWYYFAGPGREARLRDQAELARIDEMVFKAGAAAPTESYVRGLLLAFDQIAQTRAARPHLLRALDRQRQVLARRAEALPDLFQAAFSDALYAGDIPEIERLMNTWKLVEADAGRLGLSQTVAQTQMFRMQNELANREFIQLAENIARGLPTPIASDADLAQTETAAGEYLRMRGTDRPGLPRVERERILAPLAGMLASNAAAYIAARRDAAMARLAAKEPADREQEALTSLPVRAPNLVTLARPAFDEALRMLGVAGAQVETDNRIGNLRRQVAAARGAAELESAATSLVLLRQTAQPAPDAASVQAVEDDIRNRYAALARQLAATANAHYEAFDLAPGDAAAGELAAFIAKVPDKYGRPELQPLVDELRTRRQTAESQAAAARQQARLDQLAKARATLQEEPLQWPRAVKALAAVDAAALADPDVRAQWNLAATELTGKLRALILQREPLANRATRLKQAELLLNLPDTRAILTGTVRTLQDEWTAQKKTFLLRVVNRTGVRLKVSGRGIDGAELGDGTTRDFLVPYDPANPDWTLRVEGPDGYKPSSQVLGLSGGGARELVLTGMEHAARRDTAPTPQAPAAQPAEKTGPPAAPAAVTATQPRPPAAAPSPATTAKPVPEPPRTGVLRVVLTPAEANCLLDGRRIRPGNLELEPGRSYTLSAELSGYEPFRQPVRVVAGRTNVVEVYLKKKEPSSFFRWTPPDVR